MEEAPKTPPNQFMRMCSTIFMPRNVRHATQSKEALKQKVAHLELEQLLLLGLVEGVSRRLDTTLAEKEHLEGRIAQAMKVLREKTASEQQHKAAAAKLRGELSREQQHVKCLQLLRMELQHRMITAVNLLGRHGAADITPEEAAWLKAQAEVDIPHTLDLITSSCAAVSDAPSFADAVGATGAAGLTAQSRLSSKAAAAHTSPTNANASGAISPQQARAAGVDAAAAESDQQLDSITHSVAEHRPSEPGKPIDAQQRALQQQQATQHSTTRALIAANAATGPASQAPASTIMAAVATADSNKAIHSSSSSRSSNTIRSVGGAARQPAISSAGPEALVLFMGSLGCTPATRWGSTPGTIGSSSSNARSSTGGRPAAFNTGPRACSSPGSTPAQSCAPKPPMPAAGSGLVRTNRAAALRAAFNTNRSAAAEVAAASSSRVPSARKPPSKAPARTGSKPCCSTMAKSSKAAGTSAKSALSAAARYGSSSGSNRISEDSSWGSFGGSAPPWVSFTPSAPPASKIKPAPGSAASAGSSTAPVSVVPLQAPTYHNLAATPAAPTNAAAVAHADARSAAAVPAEGVPVPAGTAAAAAKTGLVSPTPGSYPCRTLLQAKRNVMRAAKGGIHLLGSWEELEGEYKQLAMERERVKATLRKGSRTMEP